MMRKPPALIYSVAGFSRAGKTTLMVKLIKALTDKGYVTATIKDCDKKLTLDTEGKDTWKHKQAGAELAVLNTSIESAVLFKNRQEVEKLIGIVQYSVEPDIILVEGYKSSGLPKIWVSSEEDDKKAIEKENVILEYKNEFDELLDYLIKELEINKLTFELPRQDCGKCGFGNCREMAEQIYEGKKELQDCAVLVEGLILEIRSDDEIVNLNKFAANIIANVISGMVKELKGVKDTNNIEIKLVRK